jgi:hypothetical protein
MPRRFIVALVMAGSVARPALAQDKHESVVIRTGGLVADVGSDLKVDLSATQHGTTVSLEDDLGFRPRTDTWFVDGLWRVSRHNRIFGSFVRVSRDRSHALIDHPITIGGTTFQPQATVDSFLDTSYFSVDYGYAFLMTPAAEIVGRVGITAILIHTGAGLSTGASASGSVSRVLAQDSKSTTTFPVPGIYVAVHPVPRVNVNGYWRYIKATIDNVTEGSSEANAGVDVKVWRGLGAGASYYYNHVSEERSSDQFTGRVRYTFKGPQIYGFVAF